MRVVVKARIWAADKLAIWPVVNTATSELDKLLTWLVVKPPS